MKKKNRKTTDYTPGIFKSNISNVRIPSKYIDLVFLRLLFHQFQLTCIKLILNRNIIIELWIHFRGTTFFNKIFVHNHSIVKSNVNCCLFCWLLHSNMNHSFTIRKKTNVFLFNKSPQSVSLVFKLRIQHFLHEYSWFTMKVISFCVKYLTWPDDKICVLYFLKFPCIFHAWPMAIVLFIEFTSY